MQRKDWRVVVSMHVAEDDEQALHEVGPGERVETTTYFEDTLGREPGLSADPLRDGVRAGTTLVGSPETVANGVERLLELSEGGFGGVMFRAHEWADRERTLEELRAVRPLCDAAVPGRARPGDGVERMAARQPQKGAGRQCRGGAPGVHRHRPGRFPTNTAFAPSALATSTR